MGMFHKRERLAEETEGGFGYMAMTQAINETRGATYAGWKSKAMDSARGNASHELHNAFWNFSHGTNFTVVHQENPLVFAEGNQLCKVCFHSGYLFTLKKTRYVESQTNNMRYAFQLELLADPPEWLRHKYSKSTPIASSTITNAPSYITERVRKEDSDSEAIFIHKRPEFKISWHVEIAETYTALDKPGEMDKTIFRKWTKNGPGIRVLCALCFDEEDITKLEAEHNVSPLPWQIINPNKWGAW